MAKVTWLGQGEHGPDQITQWSTTFEKDKPVEVSDPSIWVRAQDDPFFKVEIEEPPKAAPKATPVAPPPLKVTPQVEK